MDFHGMKRKKLQVLCKKHGIPANLKNVEMANRLASLFHDDQTTPAKFKTMSDILSTCSAIESQQDGASADDESLVREKIDETLVNTETITSEEEEMEISKVGCMSVDHCVSNTESDLGMPKYNTHGSSSGEEQAEIHKVGRLSAEEQEESHDVVFTTPEQVLLLGDSVVDEVTDGEQRSEPVSHLYVRAGTDGEENNNMTVELLHCESGTITSPNRHALLGSFVPENSGGSKVMDLLEEESVLTGLEERNEFLGEGEIKKHTPKESELEEAAKSEELQVDCNNIIGANKNAKCHDMSDVVTASEPHTACKQDREEVGFKDESAFFTRLETSLLLGESTEDRTGNDKSGLRPHDSSVKVIFKDDSMVRGSHVPALDLGENTTMDTERKSSFSSHVLAEACSLAPEETSPFTYIHDQINDEFEELAITDELIETKVTTQRDDKDILMVDSGVSSVSEKGDGHLALYSLHINCGGDELTINRTKYEADNSDNIYFQSGTGWVSSNTGSFLNDERHLKVPTILKNSPELKIQDPSAYFMSLGHFPHLQCIFFLEMEAIRLIFIFAEIMFGDNGNQ
ncbi:unnamed protein product [Eruca vesicaria subsp. sativa]|uniref:SAP domain-containing protein n=1 Tax=Eruca vesicaria subsp. sativa TaxID=29727 RepID=A0ABC8KB11_ERUVS|nr:unnamed protein product [Eruca vesicaria subsp. sativa]